ncbi:MAG: tRNA pseudouridine(55) synthase TruB [Clostridia bacterium]|nr:tRNA pseudouridine(55) synthase TruB [Clostridia bacterium]
MNGIIVLKKGEDITSFFAVNKLRRIISIKKAGHTGTLDPMATGVLPVMLGGATRFIELLPTANKSYRAKILLGKTSDTLDITGNILSENEVNVTKEDFRKVLSEFVGEIKQIPPMYSAIKKDGVRLYELARKGIELEREARTVTIFKAELLSVIGNEYEIDVTCSAGTYIRTLSDDIGQKLGCGAVMTSLERTSANGFDIECAHTLEEIEEAVKEDRLESLIIPVEEAMRIYPSVTVSPAQATRFKNGGQLALERLRNISGTGYFRVYSPEKKFLGIGEIKEGSEELSVKKLVVD